VPRPNLSNPRGKERKIFFPQRNPRSHIRYGYSLFAAPGWFPDAHTKTESAVPSCSIDCVHFVVIDKPCHISRVWEFQACKEKEVLELQKAVLRHVAGEGICLGNYWPRGYSWASHFKDY